MKLDRNISEIKRGKYALIKLRSAVIQELVEDCSRVHISKSDIDYGDTDDSDFFVIRLKDKYAAPALAAYAMAAVDDDPEYGSEVLELARRAAEHPNRRRPD